MIDELFSLCFVFFFFFATKARRGDRTIPIYSCATCAASTQTDQLSYASGQG